MKQVQKQVQVFEFPWMTLEELKTSKLGDFYKDTWFNCKVHKDKTISKKKKGSSNLYSVEDFIDALSVSTSLDGAIIMDHFEGNIDLKFHGDDKMILAEMFILEAVVTVFDSLKPGEDYRYDKLYDLVLETKPASLRTTWGQHIKSWRVFLSYMMTKFNLGNVRALFSNCDIIFKENSFFKVATNDYVDESEEDTIETIVQEPLVEEDTVQLLVNGKELRKEMHEELKPHKHKYVQDNDVDFLSEFKRIVNYIIRDVLDVEKLKIEITNLVHSQTSQLVDNTNNNIKVAVREIHTESDNVRKQIATTREDLLKSAKLIDKELQEMHDVKDLMMEQYDNVDERMKELEKKMDGVVAIFTSALKK